MVVLYDRLLLSDGFGEVSVRLYLAALAAAIVGNFPNAAAVSVEEEIEDFPLSVKKAQYLGIVANELLTNAMKYAFAGRETGRIWLRVTLAGERVSFSVRDDGPGLPPSIDPGRASGFGLRLVFEMARQLGGEARVLSEGGTEVILEFDR
jgi:two-component sensor histidine kinase